MCCLFMRSTPVPESEDEFRGETVSSSILHSPLPPHSHLVQDVVVKPVSRTTSLKVRWQQPAQAAQRALIYRVERRAKVSRYRSQGLSLQKNPSALVNASKAATQHGCYIHTRCNVCYPPLPLCMYVGEDGVASCSGRKGRDGLPDRRTSPVHSVRGKSSERWGAWSS